MSRRNTRNDHHPQGTADPGSAAVVPGKRALTDRLQRKSATHQVSVDVDQEFGERFPFLDVIQMATPATAPNAFQPIQRKEKDSGERSHVPTGPLTEVVTPDHFRIWGFGVDSPELPPAAVPMIGQIAGVTIERPASKITILGHTSGSGSERHNDRLSSERATRTKETLHAHGVDPFRFTIDGHGESEPLVAEDGDPAGMARNRRVEVHVDAPKDDDLTSFQIGPAAPPPRTDTYDVGKGIGCADLNEQLKWLRVEKEAWNQYYQRGPRSPQSGVKDHGGDGTTIAPDRLGIIIAARSQGYHEIKDWDFFEGMIKLSMSANLNSHLLEINRAIREYSRQLHGNQGCDPSIPKHLDVPTARKKGPNDFPQAGDTAPGGQKY